MMQNDTICALATPAGGAIGIVRISGTNSLEILSRIFSKDLRGAKANTIHHGYIMSASGEAIDEVLVSVFRSPHSYTGEESAEISCHGSRYILNNVLELLVANGCRMANPGEYTQRAYLNGKLDLSQAEAVADLIASTNKATHQMAMGQLRGHFSSELSLLREQLLRLTSLLELELDFSEHEDLEFADRTELSALAQTIDARITTLARSFETGQAIKQGIPVAIVGKTNAGKSTLLNRIIHDERAIVSDIHGTTRDTIEDFIDINGVTFRLIDTAGIRNTSDTIEQIGIQRTYAAIEKSRIILWLIDAEPTEDEAKAIVERSNGKSLIIVQTKSDISTENNDRLPILRLFPALQSYPIIQISAKTGHNIEELEHTIYNAANLPTLSESDVIVSNARHYHSLITAHENITRVIEGLNNNQSGDLIAEDLRLVLSDLAEITGEGQITPQETLNNIFSLFCVGK